MLWFYFLNTVVAVAIVLAATFPRETRTLLERLDLWRYVEMVDRPRFLKIVGIVGTFLLVAGLALVGSILTGGHDPAWYLPAGEAITFGIVLLLIARLSSKEPPPPGNTRRQ